MNTQYVIWLVGLLVVGLVGTYFWLKPFFRRLQIEYMVDAYREEDLPASTSLLLTEIAERLDQGVVLRVIGQNGEGWLINPSTKGKYIVTSPYHEFPLHIEGDARLAISFVKWLLQCEIATYDVIYTFKNFQVKSKEI